MTGPQPVQATRAQDANPQVNPLDGPHRPAPSSPVQGEAGGGPGRVGWGVRSTPTRPAPTDTPTCTRGPGHRVLPGYHTGTCPGADCVGCLPCPRNHCPTCRRAHTDTTCPRCLALARLNLGNIAILVTVLPSQAINGRQAYHTHDHVPGGDAVVMLAAASPRWEPGHTQPVTTELPTDPRPPLDVLTYWANIWRAHTHQPTQLPTTMERATDYLDRQLHHIAADPIFTPLAKDLARVLHQVENVLHAGSRPDLTTVPCWDCGTRLVKVWAADAKNDHYRCSTCGEVYDQGRFERAQHDHLVSTGADRFVALADALAVTGRPRNTVRAWIRDGLVLVQRINGRVEVWWPDVRDRHRDTPQRRRPST